MSSALWRRRGVFALILVLFAALALGACGGGDGESTEPGLKDDTD